MEVPTWWWWWFHGGIVGDMDGYKRSLMAIGYNKDFKVNSELSDVSYWCS